MSARSLNDVARVRKAIEEELHERLALDRSPIHEQTDVALRCVACQGVSVSDARFCKHCGVQFNAQIVVAASALVMSRDPG